MINGEAVGDENEQTEEDWGLKHEVIEMEACGVEGVWAVGSGKNGDGDDDEVEDLIDNEWRKIVFGFLFCFVADFGLVD